MFACFSWRFIASCWLCIVISTSASVASRMIRSNLAAGPRSISNAAVVSWTLAPSLSSSPSANFSAGCDGGTGEAASNAAVSSRTSAMALGRLGVDEHVGAPPGRLQDRRHRRQRPVVGLVGLGVPADRLAQHRRQLPLLGDVPAHLRVVRRQTRHLGRVLLGVRVDQRAHLAVTLRHDRVEHEHPDVGQQAATRTAPRPASRGRPRPAPWRRRRHRSSAASTPCGQSPGSCGPSGRRRG